MLPVSQHSIIANRSRRERLARRSQARAGDEMCRTIKAFPQMRLPSGTLSQMRPPARTPRLSGIRCQMRPRRDGLPGAYTHTTNSRRGHPTNGAWHGLARSGISRAPPLPARLPTGHQPPVSGRAAQGQPDRPGRVTWPVRGSAATQGVGAGGAARFTADEAGRWGRAPIVRRRPPRLASCRRRRRLPQALASRNLTWCAPREHFGRQ